MQGVFSARLGFLISCLGDFLEGGPTGSVGLLSACPSRAGNGVEYLSVCNLEQGTAMGHKYICEYINKRGAFYSSLMFGRARTSVLRSVGRNGLSAHLLLMGRGKSGFSWPTGFSAFC